MPDTHDIDQFDNLDALKRQWQQLSARADRLEEANRRLSERLARSKVSSLQEMLAARVRRWARFGFILPLLVPALRFVLDMPWWYCVLYAMLGIVLALAQMRLAEYIIEYRLTTMPVAAAVERAMSIKLRQQRLRLWSMVACMCVLVIGAFLLPDVEREVALTGGLLGLVGGLAISIPRCLADARMARKMVEELQQIK